VKVCEKHSEYINLRCHKQGRKFKDPFEKVKQILRNEFVERLEFVV